MKSENKNYKKPFNKSNGKSTGKNFKRKEFVKPLYNDEVPELKLMDYPIRSVYDANQKKIIRAYIRIAKMWNKDEKSRKFIKHLIGAYLPINHLNRLVNVPANGTKCCILNEELVGLLKVNESYNKLTEHQKNLILRSLLEDVSNLSNEGQEEYEIMVAEFGKEIIECNICYYSYNSDKYLSKEAIFALNFFTSNMLPTTEEISKIITYNRKKNMTVSEEQQKLERSLKESSRKAKESKKLAENLDGESLNNLKSLKKQLEVSK